MTRRWVFGAGVSAALATVGCDAIVGLHVDLVLPPATAAAYHGGYPAQLVVVDDHDTHQIGAPPHAHRVAVLCVASAQDERFVYTRGGVGCADETRLTAYLLPLRDGAPGAAVCGALEPEVNLEGATMPALPKAPWGAAVAFTKERGDCGNHQATVELRLRPPKQ